MDNNRVSFIRAENGIILEIYHHTWDGSNVERHIFPYKDGILDSEVLASAINIAFGTRIKAQSKEVQTKNHVS